MIVLIMMTVTAEIMFNTNIMLIMMIMIMAMIGGGWLPLEDSFSNPPHPPNPLPIGQGGPFSEGHVLG